VEEAVVVEVVLIPLLVVRNRNTSIF
jgi:hypothetical protein